MTNVDFPQVGPTHIKSQFSFPSHNSITKMLHQFFPSSHLHLHLTFTFILFIFPPSLCALAHKYNECIRVFDCGDMKNITTFPLWGYPLPSYCGLPEFKLDCEKGYPVIDIMAERFRVRNINYESHVLKLTRLVSNDSMCPSMLRNTTLNYLFTLTPNVMNLTLFYGCSYVAPSLASNEFRCRGNETLANEIGYYTIGSSPTGGNLGECNSSITIPVLKTSVKAFVENSTTSSSLSSSLIEVMNEGFEVEWIVDHTMCSECRSSGGQCGYNSSYFHSICFCPDHPYQLRCPASSSGIKLNIKYVILIAASVLGVCSIGAAVIICCYNEKYILKKVIVLWKKKEKNDENVEGFLERCGTLAPKRYRYADIKRITNSFKHKLGQGGYGGVYRGMLPDGCQVAVKVLNDSNGNGDDFLNEVASISRTAHVNIVTLLGFCFEGLKRALIYEFMPNGSLEKYIYDENQTEDIPQLGCERTYQIAIGIAHGLRYLHRGCNTQILHLDIKPHNILLDQDFRPKISDFGLAKLFNRKESTMSMFGARGTVGYIAPEVFSRNFGVVSHKSDVYSYGMMILEMVSRRKNLNPGVSHTSEVYFPHWIYDRLVSDEGPKLQWNMNEGEEVARKMTLVGLWCIQTNPKNRPSMDKVVAMLESSHEALQMPPKPFPSSPMGTPAHCYSTNSINPCQDSAESLLQSQ